MKRKYADYPNWESVDEKIFVNKYFNNDDFKGNVSLLTAKKVNKKSYKIENGKKITTFDDNYKFLLFYPEKKHNFATMITLNDKDEVMNWFFDIAKNISTTEAGIPYTDDLYLDVILYPNGEVKLVDEDELQEALDTKDITEEEYNLAYKTANRLMEKIDGNIEKLTEFTNKYYKLVKGE